MKKLLLSFLTIVLATVSAWSDTLNYGYCTDEISGVSYAQSGVWLAGAIRIPAETAKQFAGNKITTVSVGFGTSTPKKVTVFLTYDLQGEPIMEQQARLTPNHWNNVPLTTPYEFEGRDVYVGYKIQTTTPSDYPIGFDSYTIGVNPDGDWFAGSFDANELNNTWKHVGELHGNLCLRVIVEGDNLGEFQRIANMMNLLVPSFVRPGQDFGVTMAVQNNGGADINSLEITTTVGNETPIVKTYSMVPALEASKCRVIELNGLHTNMEGTELPIKVEITGVNGEKNQAYAQTSCESTLVSTDFVMDRTFVLEEGTGLWCGWCPRGYVAMENLRDKYKDGSYIGIAIHRMTGGEIRTDPMHCYSYDGMVSRFISSFPTGVANRITGFAISPETAQAMYNQVTSMSARAVVKVGSKVNAADSNKLDVTVVTKSPANLTNHKFGIALVLTEDNVGPYKQTNYYAGGSNGAMGGFENEGSSTLKMYNDVAREIFDWSGNTSALPSTMKAQTDYVYTKTISLANVDKPENAHIIALLIDTTNGQIENAATNVVDRELPLSVVELGSLESACNIYTADGYIHVDGENVTGYEVYTLTGTCVASVNGTAATAAPKGIYVVRARVNGEISTAKVAL